MRNGSSMKALPQRGVSQGPGRTWKPRAGRQLSFLDLVGSPPIVWLLLAPLGVLPVRPLGAQAPATPEKSAARALSAASVATRPAPLEIVVPTEADNTLPELTRVAQIRDLSPGEASRGYPARVTGVLTYYDPPDYKQFLQDESAGIYVALPATNLPAGLAPGQKVEITGYSDPGGFAPMLHATRIDVLGDSSFPPARVSTVQSLLSGGEDSQWVVLKGVVRSQTVINDNTVLTLWTADSNIRLTVPSATLAPAPQDFLDAAVEVRGVCSTIFSARRQLQGVELHVPNWNQIEIHEVGVKDPFTLPLQPISALQEFHAGTSGLHRSRINGIVTLRRSDGSFFVQDASGGMFVQPAKLALNVEPGAAVEIVGFPAMMGNLPVLQDAIAKRSGRLPALVPLSLRPESPLNEDLHATLVQFDGRVIAHSTRSAEAILTVEFAHSLTDAILEMGTAAAQLDRINPGSVVRLTGVYVAQLDDSRNVRSFRLLLRSPADVVLISRPPWRTLRNTLWAMGGLAVILSVALVWVSLLRRQVRRRTLELSAEVHGHERTEAKLEQETHLLLVEVGQRKRTQTELEEKQATLQQEIRERKQAEEELTETHKQLLVFSRQAGMAEIATNVLHNVGNVLNSVNVSAGLIIETVRQSKASSLARVVALLQENAQDLGAFITKDSRGKHVPAHLALLAEHLRTDQEAIVSELGSLRRNVEHIKEIVAMQQSYATFGGVKEMTSLATLVEDSLRMNEGAMGRHRVEVISEFEPVPPMNVEKHKILQILVNLLRNAKHACQDSDRPDKRLTVRLTSADGCVRISVMDNGIGIPAENLNRIFNHGFTTRKTGHGFGLHSGALAAREMGGSLTVQSNGPGQGAMFTLELPIDPEEYTV